MSFGKCIAGLIFRTLKTYDEIIDHPKRLIYSFFCILIIGFLYTVLEIGMVIAKMPVLTRPILALTEEDYYFYQIFFTIPFLFWHGY